MPRRARMYIPGFTYHMGGTHRPSLIQSERYLLACYRYIEMNPVRASMVAKPEEYQWSSYGVNGWGDSSWLQPHQKYMNSGATIKAHCHAYRDLCVNDVNQKDLQLIRKAVDYCQPICSGRFRKQINEKYSLKPGRMRSGRPRKNNNSSTGQNLFPPSRFFPGRGACG